MSTDPNEPVELVSRPNEMLAALVVATLAEHGIEAQTTGALTSGFRTEVPGAVSVLVRRSELQRAQQILEEIEGSSGASTRD